MKKYTAECFVRIYEDGRLSNWLPCKDYKVEASSVKDAEEKATKEVVEDMKRRKIEVAAFLVNRIILPDGTLEQIAAWDESGFPI